MKKTIINDNATINNTTMEVSTMKNFTTMTWKEIVAYAKELGINCGHKNRDTLENDIKALFIKKHESHVETAEDIENQITKLHNMIDNFTDYIDNYKQEQAAIARNRAIYAEIEKLNALLETMTPAEESIIVPVGDMSSDVYYPELQAEVTKPVLNMKQGYLIIKFLSSKGKTYKATTLHGVLAKYNGHTTMKLSVLRALVANALRMTEGEPTKERIDTVLDEMVRLQYFGRAYSESNVPQFFINKVKCNALLVK